jgi:hypothetical protein
MVFSNRFGKLFQRNSFFVVEKMPNKKLQRVIFLKEFDFISFTSLAAFFKIDSCDVISAEELFLFSWFLQGF